ncbi:MAG: CvpA family protein [Bacteroidales bacterium]|nr:CvpA family protein [Bacteroidales bacterium]
MNILDIIILVCLVPAVVVGLWKGFISQAISLISIIVGVWASARFANIVGEWLVKYLTVSESVIKVISFILILVVVIVVLYLVGRMLEGVIKLVTLGWLNKLLGVIFSLAKCVIILGVVVIAFNALNNAFDLVKPSVISDSVLYPIINDIADSVFPYLKRLLSVR